MFVYTTDLIGCGQRFGAIVINSYCKPMNIFLRTFFNTFERVNICADQLYNYTPHDDKLVMWLLFANVFMY